VMHDITASEQLSRLRDRFIAAAAHEFKTPVAIVKAAAQVMARLGPSDLRRPAEAIDRECNRMDRRLQNLLVLARASSDRLQLVTSAIALRPFVSGITDEMARIASQNAVLAEFTAAPRVYADAERLSLALRDLIEDTLHTARPGSALTVMLAEQGPDALIGCRYRPLPPAERNADEFGDYDEIGINRSVAQLIVAAHGGTLEQEMTDPDQAVAWVRLPAIEPDARQ
jgi:two-component system, OmpR family, phosphate regulon sensor histidine kinase PhoR